ncbi:MAG TPA: hypothetical protein ENN43_03850 [bacterium]|nr:hypothetical protein [bacterium]
MMNNKRGGASRPFLIYGAVNRAAACLLFVAVFAGACVSGEFRYKKVYVEDWAKAPNTAELYIFAPLLSAELRYEFVLDDSLSLAAGITGSLAESGFGYGARFEANFYPQEHSLNAWFIGPGAALFSDASGGSIYFAGGVQGGYRWIINNSIPVTAKVIVQYGIGPEAEKKIAKGIGGSVLSGGIGSGMAF